MSASSQNITYFVAQFFHVFQIVIQIAMRAARQSFIRNCIVGPRCDRDTLLGVSDQTPSVRLLGRGCTVGYVRLLSRSPGVRRQIYLHRRRHDIAAKQMLKNTVKLRLNIGMQ